MGPASDETEAKNPTVEEIPLPVVIFSSQPPIVAQPTGDAPRNEFMTKPGGRVPNCPPGLEYLAPLDEIHITRLESEYTVTNKQKEKIYKSRLITAAKYFAGAQKFAVKIFDNNDREIMTVDHAFGCESCFCWCFPQKLHVVAAGGEELGVLQQEWNVLYPTFAIRVGDQDVVYRIEGPCCQMECCSDTDFKIITSDGTEEIGRVTKKLDPNTAAYQNENFGVCFPSDLDVRFKAVLLGACFLIDSLYFKTASQ